MSTVFELKVAIYELV